MAYYFFPAFIQFFILFYFIFFLPENVHISFQNGFLEKFHIFQFYFLECFRSILNKSKKRREISWLISKKWFGCGRDLFCEEIFFWKPNTPEYALVLMVTWAQLDSIKIKIKFHAIPPPIYSSFPYEDLADWYFEPVRSNFSTRKEVPLKCGKLWPKVFSK